MHKDNDVIKSIIDRAASAAADRSTRTTEGARRDMDAIPDRDSPMRQFAGHPKYKGGYLGQEQIGEEIINVQDKAQREAIAKAYLFRKADKDDPVWSVIKKDLPTFMKEMPHLKMLAISKRYYEKVNRGIRSDMKGSNTPPWMADIDIK